MLFLSLYKCFIVLGWRLCRVSRASSDESWTASVCRPAEDEPWRTMATGHTNRNVFWMQDNYTQVKRSGSFLFCYLVWNDNSIAVVCIHVVMRCVHCHWTDNRLSLLLLMHRVYVLVKVRNCLPLPIEIYYKLSDDASARCGHVEPGAICSLPCDAAYMPPNEIFFRPSKGRWI